MQSKFFLGAICSLLLAAAAVPAQAGILTNIKVTSASHLDWYRNVDDTPAIPFEGTLTSNLQTLNSRSCRSQNLMGNKYSRCIYESDFSGLVSPYVAGFKSRFKTDEPMMTEFFVDLSVQGDGHYSGALSFVEGKDETYTDQSGSYQLSLNTNYQFWYEGNGIAPTTVIDAAFVNQIWNAGVFTRHVFSTQWYVLQFIDADNAVTTEFEQWNGNFETTATVPEPAAPLLFMTGLLALALRRARR